MSVDDPYAVVSMEALDLIEEQRGTLLHRLRMASVFVLLSLNTKFGTTKWGAQACHKRLGMAHPTAQALIKELEQLRFEDSEPVLERLQDVGKFAVRRPTRRNPIIIPHILKDREPREDGSKGGIPGSSFIERMFSGDNKFPVKARRLMMLMRIYAAFDESNMSCHSLMFQPLEDDPDHESLGVKCAFSDTRIFITEAMSSWMVPTSRTKREESVRESILYLSSAGLISIVRLVHSEGYVLFIASYSSCYWRNRLGDFQSDIRNYVDGYAYAEVDRGFPVLFCGGVLAMSIIPQRIVMTRQLKRTLEKFKDAELDALEELEE
ncbi:MAG: hypothetical protein RPU94_04295 [Candidatus Sedimenticola sp. (ex Thyasira tokunagai)]